MLDIAKMFAPVAVDVGTTLQSGVSQFVSQFVNFKLAQQSDDYTKQLTGYQPISTTVPPTIATTTNDISRFIPLVLVAVIALIAFKK